MQNPFVKIYVPTVKEIIDRAEKQFREKRAEKREKVFKHLSMKGNYNREQIGRQATATAISVYYDSLRESLNQPKLFPDYSELPKFYRDLYMLTEDENHIKMALGKITAARRVLKKVMYEEKGKLFEKRGETDRAVAAAKGRLLSVIGSLEKELYFLKETAKKMEDIPVLEEGLPTAVIAGFPNVGKSTLLAKLTGSKPKIAAYEFTTTSLNIGFVKSGPFRIQVIDTPGITEKKPEELSNVEKKALLALNNNASLAIFVADCSESSGRNLDGQKELFEALKRGIDCKWLAYLSKTDIADRGKIEKYRKEFNSTGIEGLLEGLKASVLEEKRKKML